MTSQSPRIYLYKITFEEVPYYYYGVHKEKRYNEYYMGSPYTHKWCWDFYTPVKQILEIFEYTDDGWLKANEVEKRIIAEFYNSDKWCLNESIGGIMSLDVCRKCGVFVGKNYGKTGGKKTYEQGLGIHSYTREQKSEYGKIGGRITAEKRSKEFALISPEGKIVKDKNIRKFCRKNNLNQGNIVEVLNGNRKQYKGWKKYISDNITVLDFL